MHIPSIRVLLFLEVVRLFEHIFASRFGPVYFQSDSNNVAIGFMAKSGEALFAPKTLGSRVHKTGSHELSMFPACTEETRESFCNGNR